MPSKIQSLAAILVIAFAFLRPLAGYPAMQKPAANIAGLEIEGKNERVMRVTTARVVVADYELIRRDFPQVKDFSPEKIDQWLLDNMAYISQSQAIQTEVNTNIPVDITKQKEVFRPKYYGRAWVAEMEGGGLMDAKGVGTILPSQASHGNGLATTGECLREYLFEKMTEKALRAAKVKASTVGTYAVFDFGFDVVHENGDRSPAGAVLRQAHARLGHLTTYDPKQAFEIESALRPFGITSAGDVRLPQLEMLNIQTAKSGDLVDFGAFLVTGKFEKPAFAYSEPILRGASTSLGFENATKVVGMLQPKSPYFPQPDPAARVPLDQWGPLTDVEDPKLDRVWARMHELAEAFRHGHMNADQTRAEIGNYLKHLDERFAHFHPGPKPLWESFFLRLEKGFADGTIMREGQAAALWNGLNKIDNLLPEDLAPITRMAEGEFGPGVQLEAMKMYAKPYHAWSLMDQPPWPKIYGLLNNKSLAKKFAGFKVMGDYLTHHDSELLNPTRAVVFARWAAEALISPTPEMFRSFYFSLLVKPSFAPMLYAELDNPKYFERLKAALNGPANDILFMALKDRRPNSQSPNLLKALVETLAGGKLENRERAFGVLLGVDPLPEAVLAEIEAALPSMPEPLNAKVQTMIAEQKLSAHAAPNCQADFSLLSSSGALRR